MRVLWSEESSFEFHNPPNHHNSKRESAAPVSTYVSTRLDERNRMAPNSLL